MKYYQIFLLLLSSYTFSFAQISENSTARFDPIVWTEPPFPTQVDDITLYYDATAGNGALGGFSGDVYAHTGVITNQSTAPNDWKHVQGIWGTPDPKVLMTSEGNDVYSLAYNIEDFYEINGGEVVEELAFVFRNSDGSIVGRASDGADIYLEIYPPNSGLLTNLVSPQGNNTILFLSENLLIDIEINKTAQLDITDNGISIFSDNVSEANFTITANTLGTHVLGFTITDGQETDYFERTYFVLDNNEILVNPPANTKNGLNYHTDSTYIFSLTAPQKRHSFLLCPANNYAVDIDYKMHKSQDEDVFWIELPTSLFTNGQNTYQYLVDGLIKIADPYSEVVLDPSNDGEVSNDILNLLPSYPDNMTTGIVTAFDLEEDTYNFQVTDFEKPAQSNLIIYEILMRDFLEDHSYQSLLDTLDYLDRLGVNAIELMPINEFEGNNSWGYNPSFHMAVDKYYGSRDQLRAVIDAAHQRGIAVILDVVFNHAFSQSPLCQLYWNAADFRPSPDNPWLNETPKHPFNVGYDFNHESIYTKKWVKQILEYWITEYHFDGFRFDLSKGFTQLDSGNNSELMSQFDVGRVNILKDYANHIWSLDSDAYVIMEHFAVNNEERSLANHGMMLWANTTHQFAEAAMGYPSDLDGADYTHPSRNWDDPHLIAYMESHDEERISYKIKTWGASNNDYNTKELTTSTDRVAAVAAVYFSIPGPKMLWQFGELGYDFSINRCEDGTINANCRLDRKPIRWDYQTSFHRSRLYERIAAITFLKNNYATFSTTDFSYEEDAFLKKVYLNHPDMDAVTIANFNISSAPININFPNTGIWYEYFTGDELNVTNTQEELTLRAGEYRIYTTQQITPPNGYFPPVSTHDIADAKIELLPNLAKANGQIKIQLVEDIDIDEIKIQNIQGISKNLTFDKTGNIIEIDLPQIPTGMYLIHLQSGQRLYTEKLVIQN